MGKYNLSSDKVKAVKSETKVNAPKPRQDDELYSLRPAPAKNKPQIQFRRQS